MEQILARLRALSAKAKLLILLAITGLCGFIGYTDAIEPAHTALDSAKAEDDQLSKELEGLSKASKSVVTIEGELKKIDEDLKLLMESLPTEAELEKVLGYLATSAKETGSDLREFKPIDSAAANPNGGQIPTAIATPVSLLDSAAKPSNIAPVAPSAMDTVSQVRFNIVVSGYYSQVVSFFDRVLSLPRVMRLETFTIKSETPARLSTMPRVIVEAGFVAFTQKAALGVDPNLAPKLPPPPPPPAAPENVKSNQISTGIQTQFAQKSNQKGH